MKIVTNLEYVRGHELGRGHFGIVYLVDDPQLGGRVAVKEIPKVTLGNPTDYFNEAQAMFASECPNVVPIRYASQTPDHVCLAMPYLRNSSLDKLIAAGPITIPEVVKIGQQILSGLSRIHLANLVHFDVKPSNIMFSDSGEAMVADFGLTAAIAASGLAVIPGIYTVNQPPETVGAFVGSVVCDVYQAALTLYRAVNGEPFWKSMAPSPGTAEALILAKKWPNRKAFLPHVPHRLRTILRTGMHFDKDSRFQSATAFADALARLKRQRFDWTVTLLPNDEIEWRSAPKSQSPRLVTLTKNASGSWDAKQFKDGQKRRACDPASWKLRTSRDEAIKHLDGLFEKLEQPASKTQ